ncbi:unnamed protein product [Candidula unifasciata]|uniref:G-protein coupled receptors family 1 profile domain-containing protein n=1 Tax=Candidula unifasciata TaxID=100452 RepID=A0A8S4A6W7_9EUPU|nr:unnamed protein product [Candidula unifasciata]
MNRVDNLINVTSAKANTPKVNAISNELLSYLVLINFWGPGQCIAIMGLILNILNIVTFIKQGLRDSVNISLLSLAVSDLGSLLFQFVLNLFWTPSFKLLDLPYSPQHLLYFMYWIHVLFTRVTTGTTAWVTFERCLCIVSPLKVKSIVTAKRTIFYIYTLYVIMAGSVAPIFYTTRLTMIFDRTKNKSVLGYVKIANRDIESVTYALNNILPSIFFVFIVVCTCILVRALQKNARMRQRMTSNTATVVSSRDTKVAKLVTIISLIFIFCYAPNTILGIMPLIDPEMKLDKSRGNVSIVIASFMLLLESVNAGSNFFIYISMSSRFKATFRQVFCMLAKNTADKSDKEML